jgi:hypothetical protein|tara:strand:+ start:732 stop:836 length:105 start_codon:yes stop_codon:yes gene_type:complete
MERRALACTSITLWKFSTKIDPAFFKTAAGPPGR